MGGGLEGLSRWFLRRLTALARVRHNPLRMDSGDREARVHACSRVFSFSHGSPGVHSRRPAGGGSILLDGVGCAAESEDPGHTDGEPSPGLRERGSADRGLKRASTTVDMVSLPQEESGLECSSPDPASRLYTDTSGLHGCTPPRLLAAYSMKYLSSRWYSVPRSFRRAFCSIWRIRSFETRKRFPIVFRV